MNAFDVAMHTITRAAGDDLDQFLADQGIPTDQPRVPVSREALLSAARVMLRILREEGRWPESDTPDSDEELLSYAEAMKGDALEAWWEVIGSKEVRKPENREKLLAWITAKSEG